MKYKLIYTLLPIFILSISVYGQRHERMKAREKMEELKKIKLIEILQMDEETSIKFFTRRSEHMRRMEDIHQAEEKKITQLRDLLEAKEKNSSALQKAIDDYLSLQEDIIKERQNFFKSTSEILSVEQMAKFVVFEEQFREEISGLLFRERNKRPRDNR
jgi:hypothetical protein